MGHLNFFVVLSILIVTALADDPRVRISSTDPPVDPVYDMIVQEKDKDVQLTCIVENKPFDQDVQWVVKHENSSITQATTATKSFDAFKWAIDTPSTTAWRLRIQNVQVSSEGTYICQVQVSSQVYKKDMRDLRVVQIPRISDLETSSDMTLKFDASATLDCHATGRPEPLIKWTRMAGELLPSGGQEFLGNRLVINRIQSDHAGIYKCTALNSAGQDEREIKITVNFRPEMHAGSPIVKQAVGYLKQLVCNVKGYPPPTGQQISWMKEGQPVLPGGRIEIRNIPGASNRITSILAINGVQSSDFGRYRCTAKNDVGSRYVEMELQSSPVPTEDRSGSIRSTASFTCVNMGTAFMIMAVCLLQRLQLHR